MPDSRYRITERIAAGGMAEVFKGIAESLQGFRKSIAIKRILPALTKNKTFVAMFLDEARLSLHLQHANIVQVFDIGHADETYFIVMEYVEGVDLKGILEWRRRIGRRLTVGQTVYIIMEICKGLAYAHDLAHPETDKPLGIVHRDVSPPNVLVSRQGEVKLADFGLAKAASQLETTDPGVVKGKMSYLSPEAARGEEVDHRADIFAVGILLYEALTGKRLFYGDTDYQTVELVRAAKIPPIGPQNPEVESELEEICRKALTKRVEDRFQSAADLQDALAHYLFSRGLKMIQRDIADLVRACTEDLATMSGARKPKPNIIDTLLQQEINAFTSLESEEQEAKAQKAKEKRPTVPAFAVPDEFIDPRVWADDPDWPGRRSGNASAGAAPANVAGGAGTGGGRGPSGSLRTTEPMAMTGGFGHPGTAGMPAIAAGSPPAGQPGTEGMAAPAATGAAGASARARTFLAGVPRHFIYVGAAAAVALAAVATFLIVLSR